MFQENISDQQRRVIQELVDLCDEAKTTHFLYTGSVGEDGTVSVTGASQNVRARSVDMRRLQRMGYLSLEWSGQFKATGNVSSKAVRAAQRNFGRSVAVFIYDCARGGIKRLVRSR